MSFSIHEMKEKNPKLGLNPAIKVARETDVLIAGSGPIGATYALYLINAGYRVIMVEQGAADSFKATAAKDGAIDAMVPGFHKKNEIEYQKDIDRFVHVINGALSTVSVPTDNTYVPDLDPLSFTNTKDKPYVSLAKNPHQNPWENLGAQKVTRGVGGMSTHWTCSVPRFDHGFGRPVLDADRTVDDDAWKELYPEAEELIGMSEHEFDESIRHTLVLKTLQSAYASERRPFQSLPLACKRNVGNKDYVEWHAAERILRPIYVDAEKRSRFTLLTNHRCTRFALAPSPTGEKVIGAAEVRDLLEDKSTADSYITAKVYITAGGAVATPQILFNSGFAGLDKTQQENSLIPNLGLYITEQPMTFCQIILSAHLMNSVKDDPFGLPWWKQKVDEHIAKHPEDPITLPFRDPEPQVTTRVSRLHPWHTQIHRDAFSYGAVAETIDSRLVVDFRFFAPADQIKENRISFETDVEDAYGMPQPTFRVVLSPDDRKRSHDMMADMCAVATKLGGYLPGSEPRFLEPGLALHLCGTTRIGLDTADSVADTYSKVHNFTNLYVGGNNNIETGPAANPTLTSMCLALRSVKSIIASLPPPDKK